MSAPFDVVRAGSLPSCPPSGRWLITDLWSAPAVGVIGGAPKSGKTWLGLDMAVSVATATPCLGHFSVPRPGPCLLYLAEDAPHMVRERLASLCQQRSIDIKKLDISIITVPTIRLDNPEHLERLDSTLQAHKPIMLLLDPLVRLHTRDENSSQEISSILDSLRSLQRTHSVCIVLVHHTRKTNATRAGQTLRGSSDIWAWGDSYLFISNENGRLRLTVEHRAAPAPIPITLQLVSNPPHLVVTEKDKPPPSLQERVVEELARSPSPLNRTELRKRLAVNNKRLGNSINQLVLSNVIEPTPQGLRLPRPP